MFVCLCYLYQVVMNSFCFCFCTFCWSIQPLYCMIKQCISTFSKNQLPFRNSILMYLVMMSSSFETVSSVYLHRLVMWSRFFISSMIHGNRRQVYSLFMWRVKGHSLSRCINKQIAGTHQVGLNIGLIIYATWVTSELFGGKSMSHN